MSIVKRLVSQTAIYGVSSIVGRVLSTLLVSLYTARFAAAEYGIVTGLFAYMAFFNVVFTYGMETTFFRFANRLGTDRQELYDRMLTLLIITSVVFSAVLAVSARTLMSWLSLPPGKEQYVVWMALTLSLDAIAAIPFSRLRLENKARKFASIRLASILLNIGLNLFFVIFCPDVLSGKYLSALRPIIDQIYDPKNAVGYVFLSTLGASLFTLILLSKELLDFRPRLQLKPLQPLLKYAYPILLMGLAGMVNEMLDRIMLPTWLPKGFYPGQSNLTAIGIYGACYKLSVLMNLAIQAFKYAAEPFFFDQSIDKNSSRTFAITFKWFTLSCMALFVGVSVNLDLIAPLFLRRTEYLQGLPVVPVLLLAYLFLGVYWNLSVWFKLTDKTHYGSFLGAAGAVITVVFNFLLIPLLGYMGSALATLACYFVMAVLCWWLGEQHFPVPYPMARLMTWMAVAIGVVAVSWWTPVVGIWARHGFHVLLTLSFLSLIAAVEGRRLRNI